MLFTPNALDQNCAARRTLDLIADKWVVLLIYALAGNTRRFGELRQMIQGVTPKMLTQTLRDMETNGMVYRTVYAVVPPKVEYALTPLGETLIVPLTALCQWSEEHGFEIESIQQNMHMLEREKAEL